MNGNNVNRIVFGWLFCLVFLILGILNAWLIHIVPGLVYIGLSFVYAPPLDQWIGKQLHFLVPFYLKVIFALIILWGTLAVGDLAEYFGL